MCTGLATFWGCRDEETDRKLSELRGTAKMETRLVCLSGHISLLSLEEDEEPPTKMGALVEWLRPAFKKGGDCDLLDEKAKVLRDVWGQELKLVLRDGRLSAIGSKGPNGRWEKGKGDDIVQELDLR